MNQDTLLYRQIPERYVSPDGHVSSLAFRPMPKDESMLSVYDGDKIQPEEAFVHFTHTLGCSSVGILAVNGAECENKSLAVREDYGTHPYHALIDFSGKKNKECRTISEYLREMAMKRGWLYEKH
ncbi:MAG: hypothetical protein IJS08_14690 [Victivallales bacterium]|nr:hypothetical protein [Victivallales bacterium]